MMTQRIVAQIEVHSICEISPVLTVRAPLKLKLSAEIDVHALKRLLTDWGEEYGYDELNKLLNMDGINILCNETII